MVLEQGRAIGYRKGKNGGTWIARHYDATAAPPIRYHALGAADDVSDADGKMVLNYSQALEAAREWFKEAYHEATGDRVQTGAYTVKNAITAYIEDRKKNGAKTANRIEYDLNRHVVPYLGDIELGKLTRKRLEEWQQRVAASPTFRAGREGKTPKTEEEIRARRASVNRLWKNLKAAFNLALHDKRLPSDVGWKDLRPLKDTKVARQRFLTIPTRSDV